MLKIVNIWELSFTRNLICMTKKANKKILCQYQYAIA